MIIIFASVMAALIAVSGFMLWHVGSLKTDLVGKVLMAIIGIAVIVFATSTWLWALRWPKVNEPSPWRFVFGPRPQGREKVSAWRWGRCAWAAWLAGLFALLLLILTHLDEVSL